MDILKMKIWMWNNTNYKLNQNYAGGLLLEAGGRRKEKNLDDVN